MGRKERQQREKETKTNGERQTGFHAEVQMMKA